MRLLPFQLNGEHIWSFVNCKPLICCDLFIAPV